MMSSYLKDIGLLLVIFSSVISPFEANYEDNELDVNGKQQQQEYSNGKLYMENLENPVQRRPKIVNQFPRYYLLPKKSIGYQKYILSQQQTSPITSASRNLISAASRPWNSYNGYGNNGNGNNNNFPLLNGSGGISDILSSLLALLLTIFFLFLLPLLLLFAAFAFFFFFFFTFTFEFQFPAVITSRAKKFNKNTIIQEKLDELVMKLPDFDKFF